MQTRGEQMLALRRARNAASPPILRGGFRPFFVGGALWAVVALCIWIASLAGSLAIPSAFDALTWHRHEMLFGFVGAIITGFLLTAIPNWTGRLPIAGGPLASLFALWLAARLAVFFSADLGAAVAALLDVGFYLLLAGVAAREVLESKNRNLPIVGMIVLFGIANGLDHLAAADPLVLILHVGYAWVPVGLGLLAASQFGALPQSAAVHALTAGAMATMILAVMTRATLGHTGRELRAGPATRLIYILVTIGAVLRVGAVAWGSNYQLGLEVAGAAWAGAFLLFIAAYGPILFAPRVGES